MSKGHERPVAQGESPIKKVAVAVPVSSAVHDACVNVIRCMGADLPRIANSGHPGAPMGCAQMAHALFGFVMNFSPSNPTWPARDRFILSNGHACALQYTMLHLLNYDLTLDDLKNFRKLNSKTPGHPECFQTPGVEVCTGPLGQGFSNAVGMAIAEANLSHTYNKPGFDIFHNYTYVICGDGCLQEGVAAEAASLAGHLGLGRLIVLYDDNQITIDGNTDLSFTENVTARFQAYDWHTIDIVDGDTQHLNIVEAVEEAKKVIDRPSLIKIRTTIGYGSANQGTAKVHGAPLAEKDISDLKKSVGLDPTATCIVPDNVREYYRNVSNSGDEKYKSWKSLFDRYKLEFQPEALEIERRFAGSLPAYKHLLPADESYQSPESTRVLSGATLNKLLPAFPEFIGGSADLTGSNSSALAGIADFSKADRGGRYLRFGVREHAMAAICNGLYAYGAHRPFCATFLNFVTYGWGAVRLSALSGFGVLYIATHDSIELGEDGPTHQPIEVSSLARATPNLLFIRPADGRECAGAYEAWLQNKTRPTILALCRGGVPPIAGSSSASALRGGYVISDWAHNNDKKGVVLGGSGTELQLCVKAAAALVEMGLSVRVVSMPCWDLFGEQDEQYKKEVIPAQSECLARVYVEAASTFGWDRYFEHHIGMTTFGASGPKSDLLNFFGFTVENVINTVSRLR